MDLNRVNQLQLFLEKTPNDPFPKYALALEFLDSDDYKANKFFSELLQHHPDYLPTYYTAAHFFIDQEKFELAKGTFEKGIELSSSDLKTNAELRNAYQNFLIEYEI